MKKQIIKNIDSIITKRIKVVPNSNLVQYTDTYTWMKKDGETFLQGFKNNYPAEYKEEVDCLFDELHPY